LSHYFPQIRTTHTDKPSLLLPERLVHPGTTTILTIGLSTTFQEILEQTANVSYRDAEIGLTVFANLFSGLVPLMDAFEKYRSSRVMPLISKLESLGLIDTDGCGPSTHLEYTTDSVGTIETLRVVFDGRNEGDVRKILGETLLEKGEEVWFAIHEDYQREVDAGSLSPNERLELSEHWDSSYEAGDQAKSTASSSQVEEVLAWGSQPIPRVNPVHDIDLSRSNIDLIFPSPNTFSGRLLTIYEDDYATLTQPEPYTYPSNATSTTSLSDLWSTPTASFISEMVGSGTPSSEWSAPPSEVDSDLEADMAMSSWSSGSDEAMDVEMALERRDESSDEDSWTNTIRGGGLMQPW
jgi:hypothetical protein